MIVDADNNMGQDIAAYTGSTTGTTRNNQMCSAYTPITWQVDRKCHLISASTFDKMCADMKTQRDDMSDDLHAHGSRELVLSKFAADNHQRRLDSELVGHDLRGWLSNRQHRFDNSSELVSDDLAAD